MAAGRLNNSERVHMKRVTRTIAEERFIVK